MTDYLFRHSTGEKYEEDYVINTVSKLSKLN